jgi:hypothetical protein
VGFLTNYKKRLQHNVSLPNMRLKDMLNVMTSELLLLCTVAVHIETDNTLTSTDDLNRLTNAHE